MDLSKAAFTAVGFAFGALVAKVASRASKGAEKKKVKWWEEPVCEALNIKAKIKGDVKEFKSKFQSVKVLDTEPFGRQLILDGFSQSSQNDEHIYHESLVHFAMLLHPNPKTVFIGGGGEMATAREALKHNTVEKVIMVDIDGEVVELCKEKLTAWEIDWVSRDRRFELVINDAKKYVEDYKGKFDVVIMDIADPIAAGPGIALYFREFYLNLKEKLNPGAVFVTQSGPSGILTHKQCFTTIHSTLRSAFDNVVPFHAFMACFADCWGFNMAWDRDASLPLDVDALRNVNPEEIDKKIQERMIIGQRLRYLDGIGYRGQLSAPRYIRESCQAETRVMSQQNPVFMDEHFAPVGVREYDEEEEEQH